MHLRTSGFILGEVQKSLVHNVMIDLLHRGDIDLIIGIDLIPKRIINAIVHPQV